MLNFLKKLTTFIVILLVLSAISFAKDTEYMYTTVMLYNIKQENLYNMSFFKIFKNKF